jgi:hypothetical protein
MAADACKREMSIGGEKKKWDALTQDGNELEGRGERQRFEVAKVLHALCVSSPKTVNVLSGIAHQVVASVTSLSDAISSLHILSCASKRDIAAEVAPLRPYLRTPGVSSQEGTSAKPGQSRPCLTSCSTSKPVVKSEPPVEVIVHV